ncbi:MAG: YIP1 family protein [Defluviitaleaceae bacterium]|nr:YIP1 family protein [Defluviitaleaceae bacterium]
MTMVKRVLSFYALPLRIMVRPFSGFYEMKYEKRGLLRVAVFNFLMVCISVSFMNQYSSIVVNQRNPRTINSLVEFATLTGALILFCVSNWAVTSLTDGEGRFIDIVMAVCYAMTPIVLTFIPMTILSNVLTVDEGAFYFMVISVAVFWFAFLIFSGLVTVHNYSAAKAITTVLLTFVALLIIVFLITLLLTLWQQLVLFIRSLYTEIVFRV